MVSLLLVPFSDLLSLSTFCCNCPTRVSVAAINGDPENIWWIGATDMFKEVNYESGLICVPFANEKRCPFTFLPLKKLDCFIAFSQKY